MNETFTDEDCVSVTNRRRLRHWYSSSHSAGGGMKEHPLRISSDHPSKKDPEKTQHVR